MGVAFRGLEQRRHRLVQHVVQLRGRVLSAEQAPPGDQLPHDDAEPEQVRARIDPLAARLLGRHVRQLALDRPDGRLRRGQRVLRDAEVHQLDATVVHPEDVLRRHVAVHDIQRPAVVVRESVRVDQRREHVGDDAHRVRHLEADARPPRRAHHLRERATLEVLHDQVRQAVAIVDLVGLHDVRVVQPRREPRLVEHQRSILRLDEIGP
ncbi:MAG TPA: hypothetical protein VLT45_27485 [Kofleriaceae bacterium]|nr:hypothetical protein [Kofleriaceae bacterium]